MEFLFVYGTLRSDMGHPMHGILERYAEFIGIGTVPGRLLNLGHYPGLVLAQTLESSLLAEATSNVWGEVYAMNENITPTILALLDDYEGYNPDQIKQSEYRREKAQIHLESGFTTSILSSSNILSAWTYVYNRDTTHYPDIPSGNYRSSDKDS